MNAARNGVFRVDQLPDPAAPPAKSYAIDLAGCRDKDQALQAFAAALAFPNYFGANLDAFADCLSDLDGPNPAGYRLHVFGWQALYDADRSAFDQLIAVLRDTAELWARDATPFEVYLIDTAHLRGI